MKRHLTVIILLLVAVGLGVWLYLDRNKVTEGERKRRENNVFSAWRREELTKIEIVHEGETIVIVRDAKSDSTWRMKSPRDERVDQAAAERLLTTLEFATIVRKVGDGRADESATLGFEKPRATGSVAMGPLVIRFALGGASPRPEGSSYLKVDDGVPFVASRELTDALLASADTLRDRTVIPYLSLDLQRFELKHDGGGFTVERSDARSFKVKGLRVLASRAALDKVWGALAEMRAEAFPKDADADRLTATPRLVIFMTPKDGGKAAAELVVGDACPGHPNDVVVLRKQPTRVAACAPKGAIDSLIGITPAMLVDRRPFSFRADEIEELRLEKVGGPAGGGGGAAGAAGAAPRVIELARRGTGFHQREPVDRELNAEEAEAASEVITRIEYGVADEVRPAAGVFEAIARARVRAGEHDETIEVGAAAGGGAAKGVVILHRLRDDAHLAVSAATARLLVPRTTSTRSHTLVGESRAVKRVLLKCGATQELIDEGAGLKLVEPRGYETDGSIVQLVDGLLKGKVIAWVADADDGSFGLSGGAGGAATTADNGCRAVLSFTDGNAPLTIRLGAEGEGGVYGVIDGRPEVFVISTAMSDLIKRIYVSHAYLRAEASQIESVRVTAMGKPVTSRDPATLREAASGLFADRVVSIGSSDVGPTEIEIEMAMAEGGPKKKVICGAMAGSWRRCSVSGVKAVFDVHPAKLAGLLPPTAASDGGTGDGGRIRDAGR